MSEGQRVQGVRVLGVQILMWNKEIFCARKMGVFQNTDFTINTIIIWYFGVSKRVVEDRKSRDTYPPTTYTTPPPSSGQRGFGSRGS